MEALTTATTKISDFKVKIKLKTKFFEIRVGTTQPFSLKTHF